MSSSEDETDIKFPKIFRRVFKTIKNGDEYTKTEIAQDSETYNMEHYRRGTVIIFNHYEFDSTRLEIRKGTERDVEALTAVLENLQFEVIICNDYLYDEIYNKIKEVSEADHSDSDCLIVVVLTHGGDGQLFSKDYPYLPDTLWTPFAGDECPTLAGKPKIFLIQASRGVKEDFGTRNTFIGTDSSSSKSYTIPAMADICVMYSSYEGYRSYADPETGSWFIQCFCEELKGSVRDKDLMTILTDVNRRMATEFEGHATETNKGIKQIGSIVSTCTRLLYFYPTTPL